MTFQEKIEWQIKEVMVSDKLQETKITAFKAIRTELWSTYQTAPTEKLRELIEDVSENIGWLQAEEFYTNN